MDTITARCLSKEPEHRYPTATELADDLGRFLRGEPIAARPVGAIERAVRWARRKPAAASAYGFSSLAVVLAVLVFVIFGFWRAAEDAKGEAERAKGDAEGARDVADGLRIRAEGLFQEADGARGEALKQKGIAETALKGEEGAKKQAQREREKLARFEYGRTIQIAYQAWKNNKIAEARLLLAGTREDLHGWEYDYVHRLCHADLVTLSGHESWVSSASFSPDGSKVVTASGDNTARIWDTADVETRPFREEYLEWIRLPEGSILIGVRMDLVDEGATARIWDKPNEGKLVELKGHTAKINSVLWNADVSKAVTASNDKTARIWDAASGKSLVELKGHTSGVDIAMFSLDGSKVVTSCRDGTTRVWNTISGELLVELKGGHIDWVRSVSFSKDGSRIVTGGNDLTVRVWDAETGAELLSLPRGGSDVAFSPDGNQLLTVGGDESVSLYDPRPVNRAFLKFPLAPAPRAVER